jgi:hypothetical protein
MTSPVQPQLDHSGPLTTLLRGRAEQRGICDHLELIADQLGGPIDRRLCLSTLDRLAYELPLYQEDEEALFDILGARTQPEDLVSGCINQAVRDHRHSQDFTLEIADAIEDHLANAQTANPDALGYMLRCAFEGLRHHMAWEDVTLLGPLLQPFTDEEIERLHSHLARNRRSRAPHFRIADF